MTRGLLQQQPGLGYSPPRSASSPQHGEKTTPKTVQPEREPRTVTPRPGGQQ